jgi:hypothetical protein
MRRPPAKQRDDERLDEGLTETFPASDPIAVGRPTSTEPPRTPLDRNAVVTAGRTNTSYVAFATVCGAAVVREF